MGPGEGKDGKKLALSLATFLTSRFSSDSFISMLGLLFTSSNRWGKRDTSDLAVFSWLHRLMRINQDAFYDGYHPQEMFSVMWGTTKKEGGGRCRIRQVLSWCLWREKGNEIRTERGEYGLEKGKSSSSTLSSKFLAQFMVTRRRGRRGNPN